MYETSFRFTWVISYDGNEFIFNGYASYILFVAFCVMGFETDISQCVNESWLVVLYTQWS